MTNLKKLLKGTDVESTLALEQLWQRIGPNPQIAWYPSAGLDLRDLFELRPQHAGISAPDLFIHTDYKPDWRLINQPFEGFQTGVIEDRFEPEYFKEILEVYPLTFTKRVKYRVEEQFVDFIHDAQVEPKVYLLRVKVKHGDNTIIQPVIYFVFENINFLDEVLLRYNIKISHLVKVREGCGLGGNRKSITIAYAFAAKLGLEFLICDNEAQPDLKLIDELTAKHKLINYRFSLEPIGSIANWSSLYVTVYRLDYTMELDWILDEIYENNGLSNNE